MRQNYNYALQQVLKSEGGYTNDPRDPGGPTNYGITIADYRMYINKSGTADDVKNMHLADAQSIYRSKYWNAVNGDTLPSGVDYCVFDYGVNSGVGRAKKVYNNLKTDNPKDTINAICDERLKFLQSLGTWSHFGKGWGARVASVRAGSLALAKDTVNANPRSNTQQSNTLTSSGPDLNDIDNRVSSASNIFTTIKGFLSDNIGSLGRHVSTGSIAAAGSVSAMFTKDWPYVLAGAVVVSVLMWAGLKLYQQRNP